MASKKLKTFHVSVRINCQAGIEVKAESWEDAVAQAKQLKATDFISFHDEHADSNIQKIEYISDHSNLR